MQPHTTPRSGRNEGARHVGANVASVVQSAPEPHLPSGRANPTKKTQGHSKKHTFEMDAGYRMTFDQALAAENVREACEYIRYDKRMQALLPRDELAKIKQGNVISKARLREFAALWSVYLENP